MTDKTTIQLSKDTRAKLDLFGFKSESYDKIVNRLIDFASDDLKKFKKLFDEVLPPWWDL